MVQTIVPVLPSSAARPSGPDLTSSTVSAPCRQVSLEKSGRYSHRPLQMVSGYLARLAPMHLTGSRCPQRQVMASLGRSTMFMVVSALQLRSPVISPSKT